MSLFKEPFDKAGLVRMLQQHTNELESMVNDACKAATGRLDFGGQAVNGDHDCTSQGPSNI